MSPGPRENLLIAFTKMHFVKHIRSPWTTWASSVQSEVPRLSQQKKTIKCSSTRRLVFPCLHYFPVFILHPSSCLPFKYHCSRGSPFAHPSGVPLPIPSCHLFLKLDTHWSTCHPHNSYLDTAEAPQIQPAPPPVLPGTGNDTSISSAFGRQL